MSNIKIIGYNTGKMFVFTSNDNINYSVDIDTAQKSDTIKNLLECIDTTDTTDTTDEPIPLPNIKGSILEKVLIYCDYIQNNPDEFQILNTWTNDFTYTIPLTEWFTDYIDVQPEELVEILNAANYLHIQSLLMFGSKQVASFIRNKTPEEIRMIFSKNCNDNAATDINISSTTAQ